MKYTYQNWFEGTVNLISTPFISSDKSLPIEANWDDFSIADIQKIKIKQNEIFLEKVRAFLKANQDDFSFRYESSKLKRQLLNDEKEQCYSVLYAKIPDGHRIKLNHWSITIERVDFIEIQEYFNRVVKKGNSNSFDFIPSPNFKHQNLNKIPNQVYAQYLWEYYLWLQSSFKEQIIDTKKIKNKNKYWFKIGLLFANGEMDKLLLKHNTNFTAIAKELGNKNYRPYISESQSKSNENDKNIFSDNSKLKEIADYCVEQKITICPSFESYYNKQFPPS